MRKLTLPRLNYYETASNLKFVMNTDPAVTHPIVRDLLAKIYSQVRITSSSMFSNGKPVRNEVLSFFQIYVEYALKNPLYTPGEPIESEIFAAKLDELVKSASFFKS